MPLTRHISTPKLGKRSIISPFLSFRSGIERTQSDIPFSKIKQNNKSFEISPGPLLGHESILGPFHSVHGISKSPNIKFNSANLDRNPTRTALTSYDFDDNSIRKTPKLVTLPKDIRFPHYYKDKKSKQNCEKSDQNLNNKLNEESHYTWHSSISSIKEEINFPPTEESIYLDEKSNVDVSSSNNLIDSTKIKKKFRPPITYENKIRSTFDDSSYTRHRKPPPLDLNPIVINKLSKCKIFDLSFSKSKLYESRTIKSNVAEKIKIHL